MRRSLSIAAAVLTLLVASVAAWAYWTATGTSTASASAGSLSAPAVTAAPGSVAGSITLTFSAEALLNGLSESSITYTVYRSADGTTYAPVPSTSGCYGIAYGTSSCTDRGLTGTFRYYVVAHFGASSSGGWTAISAIAGPVAVTADATPPVTTVSTSPTANAAGWNNTSPVAVTLSADDNGGSGVKEIRYTTDDSTPTSSSTLYSGSFNVAVTTTVKYFATDNAGNAETVKTLPVKVDTVAPAGGTLTANGSASASFNTSGTLALAKTNYADANSGLAAGSNAVTRASASLTGNTCGTFSGTAAVTIDGSGNDSSSLATGCYRYTLSSADLAGNSSSTPSAIVKVDTSAPTAPSLTLSNATGSSTYISGSTVYLNPQSGKSGSFDVSASPSDADTGIAKVNFPALTGFTSGGGDDASSPYGTTYAWSGAVGASGSKTVTAYNAAGATATSLFTVTADTTAPSGGAITANGSTSDSYNTTGSVSLSKTDFIDGGSGLASGSNGISRASTTLTNGACGTTWSAPTAVTVTNGKDAATLANGCYRYTLDATDNVGNLATAAVSALVKVDTTAPTGTLTSPTAGTYGGTLTMGSTTAADAGGSGLSTVSFQEAPSGSTTYTTIATDTAAPYTANWDTTTVANGAYNLRAVMTDGAGISTATAAVAVTVTNSFSVSAPGSTRTAGSSFNVTVTAMATTATNSAYTGAHTVAFAGPSNAPDGTSPSYPASLTFVNGQATAVVTLYDAETTSVTATSGFLTGTSGSITVGVGNTPAGVTFTTSSLSLSCAASVFQCSLALNRGAAAWTSKVSLTDTWGNVGPKAPNGGTSVTISNSPLVGTLSGSPLTIAKGNTESTTQFSYTAPSGSGNYSTAITANAGLASSATTTVSGH